MSTFDHAIHHMSSGTGKKVEKKLTTAQKATAAKAIPLDGNTKNLMNSKISTAN